MFSSILLPIPSWGNVFCFLSSPSELGGGAGAVVADPAIIFVADSVSVSLSIYRWGWGEINPLAIRLGINALNIGLFSGPSHPLFLLIVLLEASYFCIVTVASTKTMRPSPLKIRIGGQTIPLVESRWLRQSIKASPFTPSYSSSYSGILPHYHPPTFTLQKTLEALVGRGGVGGGVSDDSEKNEDDSSGALSYLLGVGCICYRSFFPPPPPPPRHCHFEVCSLG